MLPNHPEMGEVLLHLGQVSERLGESAQAEPLFAQALDILEKSAVSTHPARLFLHTKKASIYPASG